MISQIQIHTQSAKLAIETTPGRFSIEQARADMEINTTQPKFQMNKSSQIKMSIDQSEAWNSLNGGSALEMNQRIYSQLQNVFLQALAKRAEEGNRLAAIHQQQNTIANIIGENWKDYSTVDYLPSPFLGKVPIDYHVTPQDSEMIPGEVHMTARAHSAQIDYERGNLNIYMAQYAKVEITPPSIDTYL